MSAATGRMLSPYACTWCGHDKHTGPCPITIQTGTAKAPDVIGCPCAYRSGSRRSVVGGLAHLLTSSGRTTDGAE